MADPRSAAEATAPTHLPLSDESRRQFAPRPRGAIDRFPTRSYFAPAFVERWDLRCRVFAPAGPVGFPREVHPEEMPWPRSDRVAEAC